MLQRTTAQAKISKLNKRVRVVRGGTSASKTFTIVPFLIDYAVKNPLAEISIVAETIPHLKRGALRDFLKIMDMIGMYEPENFNKSTLVYSFSNGSYIEFFSADVESKLRGARRDVLFVNECNNITWESYYQMAIRTRRFIYLDYNPVSEFWVDTELINDVDTDFIVLTYKDNEALDPAIIKEIEKAKEKAKTSNYWKNWWSVYGLGNIGNLQGAVFENWQSCKEIPSNAEFVSYGMDWGFTADPTTLVGVWKQEQNLYIKEFIYQRGLTNDAIATKLKELNVKPTDIIIADSAEPKSIQEVFNFGFNIKPASKGPDSIKNGIDVLLRYKMFVTEDSTNIIKELRSYKWDTDKDGKAINKPIDAYNHCFSGDTLITTNKGDVRIDNIKVGDLILTSKGFKRVLKTFNNGVKLTQQYLIQSDTFCLSLRSTKEHKVKIKNGWKQISKLKLGETVYLCRNFKGKNISYIETKDIFLKEEKDCTLSFGNFLMALLIKINKFITSIKIALIIILTTLKRLIKTNIYQNMVKKDLEIILNGQKNFRQKELLKRLIGISQKKVENGIQNQLKNHTQKDNTYIKPVNNVTAYIKQDIQENQNIAIITAKLKHLEQGESRYENVYDLMIEDEHEYFANGLLVHNCIDAIRYVALNQLANLNSGRYTIM